MFCSPCEMKHEICEFVMKPGRFEIVQMCFNMTNKFANVLVVPAEYLNDFSLLCSREMQSLR